MLLLPAVFLLGGQGPTSSPIQADTARQFRQKCMLLGNSYDAGPAWGTFCSCLERELPQRLTFEEYYALMKLEPAAMFSDSRVMEMVAGCTVEGLSPQPSQP
jgi:hypothetical protein